MSGGVWEAVRETLFMALAMRMPRHQWMDVRRWRLLRLAGVDAAPAHIRAPVFLTQPGQLRRIRIGARTFVNVGLRIGVGLNSTVSIGEDCAIGPFVQLETMGHELVYTPEKRWGAHDRSIAIGDRCWLGARVVVVGGVTIGDGAVVAAGSVVTKDVPPYTLVAGTPAREMRALERPAAYAARP